MNIVASYKQPVTISGLKRVNLFYGLNGTGKSTLSKFLAAHNQVEAKFSHCSITFQENKFIPEILVYNQDFVNEHFLSTDMQKGIFTLDKANIDAETKIKNAQDALKRLKPLKDVQYGILETAKTAEKNDKKTLANTIWKEKTAYENTTLRPCLEGYMGSKDAFFNRILSCKLSETTPEKITSEIDRLKNEYEQLSVEDSREKTLHPLLDSDFSDIEKNPIFQEKIVGSQDSYLSDLIAKLDHEHWITEGITQYIDKTDKCPFCKQGLNQDLKEKIKAHIDSNYQAKKEQLQGFLTTYTNKVAALEERLQSYLEDSAFSQDTALSSDINALKTELSKNLLAIEKKTQSPSEAMTLELTHEIIEQINIKIKAENDNINQFNEKLKNRSHAKNQIKIAFWGLLRKKHDAEILTYNARVQERKKQTDKANNELAKITEEEKEHNSAIIENQKKTKNVETAINRINHRLRSFGLDGFEIERVNTSDENQFLYKIIRENTSDDLSEFKTLSEGEKTLISFLYFIEACVGVSEIEKSSDPSKRIIVIDDPISSLSFNLVFDVATLIKDLFLTDDKYRQIFILTHHLYFLHEFLGMHKNGMNKNWALFRVSKSDTTTSICTMGKDDIKNNYEGYWQLLREAKEGRTAKIALPNAMRNILEQYFSFIHGQDHLTKTLKEMAEKNASNLSYKSFDRYINRESHSDATNYVDADEIDVDKYLQFFEKVFESSGHPNHFQVMMGDKTDNTKILPFKQTGS